jgi:hypothetical protein
MKNILTFPDKNKKISVDEILDCVKEVDLKSIIIIGLDQEGHQLLFSTSALKSDIGHQLNLIMHRLYNGEFDVD